MPALSAADRALLRSPYYDLKRYISVCPRTPVFQAEYAAQQAGDSDADTQGMIQLRYENVSLGTSASIASGMTLGIGTAPGLLDLGTMRVRKAATSTVIPVGESAPGATKIEAPSYSGVDKYITVFDERRIWPRLPLLDQSQGGDNQFFDTFSYMIDYDVAYSDQQENFVPLANVVGVPAGFLDDGQTYRTVTLSAATSAAVANGASISSFSWNLKDGSFASGYSSTDSVVKAQFPRGFRYVELTVINSTGKSSTRYFPVWAHDTLIYPPFANFTVTRDDTEAGTGREMGFQFFGYKYYRGEDVIPKGTLMCYWEDITFDGQPAPDQYRSYCLGWSTREAVELPFAQSTWSVEIGGPAWWLSRIDGYSTGWMRRTSPSRWFHMADITDDRVVATVLRYFTTALDVCNLQLSGYTHEWGQTEDTYFAASVDKMPIWNQIETQVQSYGGAVGADSAGTIWLRQLPSLIDDNHDLQDRADVPVVDSFAAGDWPDDQSPSLAQDLALRVGWVQASGFGYGGSNTVHTWLAKAPGRTPEYPAGGQQLPGQCVIGSSSANAQLHIRHRLGHWWAWLNNPRPDVPLTLLYNLDAIEPAWRELVELTVDADNIREESLDQEKFVVQRVSVTHSNDPQQPPKRVHLALAQHTEGGPGQAYDPPEVVSESDTTDDWYNGDSWGDDEGDYPDAPDLVYAVTLGDIRRSTDFTSTSTWSSNLFSRPTGFVFTHAALAQSDPKNTMYVALHNGSTGEFRIYRTTNLGDTPPSWTLVHTLAYTGAHFGFLRNVPWGNLETWFFFYQGPSKTLRCAHTHDNWSTVTDVQINSDQVVTDISSAVEVSGHASDEDTGIAWGGGRTGGGNPNFDKSTDWGATWGAVGAVDGTDTYPPVVAMMPWLGNEDEQELFVMGGNASVSDAFIKYSNDQAVSWSDVTPQYDGYGWGGGLRDKFIRELLHAYTPSADYLAVAAYRSHDKRGLSPPRLFVSTDRGQNWTHRQLFGVDIYNVNGWPYDSDYLFFSGNGKLFYSDDFGVTLTEKQWGGYGTGVCLLPIWVS